MTPELIIAIEVCLKAGKPMLRHDALHIPVCIGEHEPVSVSGEADKEAFRLVAHILSVTGLPVLGACSEPVPYSVRSGWRRFWLVSLVDREAEYSERTLGVALIEGHEPVLGVVYAPASDELFCASRSAGAYRVRQASCSFAAARKLPLQAARTAYGSVSPSVRLLVGGRHLDERMRSCIEDLGREYPHIELVRKGGAMNFCLVAAGEAELYPRVDTTCEWETAAGHAILKATGKNLVDLSSGSELTYNKPEMVNPHFLAR